ncbi:hypothetical protein ACFO0S_00420 [Chryseomicrobium palamuruense]|uniref:Uncharacterized protein n=1 Tax=Chryseomicrobium palamuruense TaxID=682973 RepID=A0ABV8UQL8_9BACL
MNEMRDQLNAKIGDVSSRAIRVQHQVNLKKNQHPSKVKVQWSYYATMAAFIGVLVLSINLLSSPFTDDRGQLNPVEPSESAIPPTTEDDGVIEKPDIVEPVDPSHLFMELNSHGEQFPKLEEDLRNVMSTPNVELGILEAMNDSVNGVSINENGMVLVEFKDFGSEVPSPSSEVKTSLLGTLYDSIFKYSEVQSAQFSFEGNLTAWQEWIGTYEPMVRQIVFDLNTHGKPFPELEKDLNNLMIQGYTEIDSRNIEVLADSVNGVAINEHGTVVVEFKDFRNDFGSLTSNEKSIFLTPIRETVFKYPEVKEVYFTFEGSFNHWCEWLESTYEPMTRKYDIEVLLANHTFYKTIHQTLLDGNLIDPRAADVFVVYLEALRNKDLEEVKKYSSSTDDDIETLFEIHQKIDYISLSIESINNSEGEPVSEIHLTFKQHDGTLSSGKYYLEFYDDGIKIQDGLRNN